MSWLSTSFSHACLGHGCQDYLFNPDAAYFDVDFAGPNIRKPTVFTTGPHGTPTHWKQTLLYLQEPLDVPVDGVLQGTLQVSRNVDNPRAVDIRVEFSLAGAADMRRSQLYHLL